MRVSVIETHSRVFTEDTMKKFILFCTLTLLAGCEAAPAGYTPQPISFAATAPMRVDVAEIRVVENYQSSMHAPNVEYEFATPPAAALKQWAKQRLVAAGPTGVLEVSIDDASVKEVPLPKTEGIKGIFTDDQDARYDARMSITMRLYNGENAMSVASADVVVERSRSIHEKATIDERERMFDMMTREMIATFDQQATARLRQYFNKYLR